jgi:hypothetical protein
MTTTLAVPPGPVIGSVAVLPATPPSQKQKRKPHVTVEEEPTADGTEINDPDVLSVEVLQPPSGGVAEAEVQQKWTPMTAEELEQLNSYETILSKNFQAFIEVGRCLGIIQAQGLYREKAPTFKEYLAKNWDFTPQRAWQLIGASDFATIQSTRIDPAKLPSSERAMRELMKAPEDKIVEVLEEARRDGEPTAERINAARLKVAPPKAKDGKPKRIPPVKIEAAMKAGATWSRFLKECNPEQLDETQRTQVTAFQSESATAFTKLSLGD